MVGDFVLADIGNIVIDCHGCIDYAQLGWCRRSQVRRTIAENVSYFLYVVLFFAIDAYFCEI